MEKSQKYVDRTMVGYGHIVLPSDVDRDVYIRKVRQDGSCSIITIEGEVINEVLIPINLIEYISVPQLNSELGSLVNWMCDPRYNTTSISNVLPQPNSQKFSDEFSRNQPLINGESSLSVSETVSRYPARTVVLRSKSGESYHETIVQGVKTSSVRQSGDGTIVITAESDFELTSESKITHKISNEEGVLATFEMDSSGKIVMDSTSIEIGSANLEASLKGDSVTSWLNDLVSAILGASWVETGTNTTPGPLNIATFNTLQSQLETLKSSKLKVE